MLYHTHQASSACTAMASALARPSCFRTTGAQTPQQQRCTCARLRQAYAEASLPAAAHAGRTFAPRLEAAGAIRGKTIRIIAVRDVGHSRLARGSRRIGHGVEEARDEVLAGIWPRLHVAALLGACLEIETPTHTRISRANRSGDNRASWASNGTLIDSSRQPWQGVECC